MPTYDYRCGNCGHELEIFQSIKVRVEFRVTFIHLVVELIHAFDEFQSIHLKWMWD